MMPPLKCDNCGARPAITELDGDNLCQQCADAWVRAEGKALAEDIRPYPELLNDDENRALLKRAEDLWADLQRNNLGGFSGINRPFYIVHEFKRVIEEFGKRDVGLHWSKNDLDIHQDRPQ